MKTMFFLYAGLQTDLTRKVQAGIARLKQLDVLDPGQTSFTTVGLRVCVGPDGPYVESDRYPHDYPAYVNELSVWRVSLHSTLTSPNGLPGIFVDGDVKACLGEVCGPATGRSYFELVVEGPTLVEVRALHRAILEENAEPFRTETWPIR